MLAFVNYQKRICLVLRLGIVFFLGNTYAQNTTGNQWIRPDDRYDEAVWGIEEGIVIGLWPSPIEIGKNSTGGPRGLFRIGYSIQGKVYHINYIAVEPVVDGEMEFSEISPSTIDGAWGKLMWAGEDERPGSFFPSAITRGKITNPDPSRPEVEELSLFVYMEKFKNGAHPYLKISIRSDRPEEIGFEIFHQKGSAEMDRCVLTATMGNYARLRKLHLKDGTKDSNELYKGYNDIHFIEKEEYPITKLARNSNGDFIAVAETDESFTQLASWPQTAEYFEQKNWRYRPYFKLVQYWRKEAEHADESLSVRVNGRATYWAGGSNNKKDYIAIPGGPAFENFEMRENYQSGQKFYFGISRKTGESLLK
ncbi:hypothetical protein [Salegentibacter sp. F14]